MVVSDQVRQARWRRVAAVVATLLVSCGGRGSPAGAPAPDREPRIGGHEPPGVSERSRGLEASPGGATRRVRGSTSSSKDGAPAPDVQGSSGLDPTSDRVVVVDDPSDRDGRSDAPEYTEIVAASAAEGPGGGVDFEVELAASPPSRMPDTSAVFIVGVGISGNRNSVEETSISIYAEARTDGWMGFIAHGDDRYPFTSFEVTRTGVVFSASARDLGGLSLLRWGGVTTLLEGVVGVGVDTTSSDAVPNDRPAAYRG